MLILGIDDAGRGPVIGSMFISGVLLSVKQESLLLKAGVTDSKLIEHEKRIELSKLIKANSNANKVFEISAKKIDNSLSSGTNLNILEANYMAEVINSIAGKYKGIEVIIDCPSVNIESWKKILLKFVQHSALNISCEHKADMNHISVAAASILAKVKREEHMQKLKNQYKEYGNVGSGYPSDPITKIFLKENGMALKDTGIFRTTWLTWKRLFPDKNQKSLTDY